MNSDQKPNDDKRPAPDAVTNIKPIDTNKHDDKPNRSNENKPQRSAIDFIQIATIALAIATFALAWYTSRLADETAKMSNETKRLADKTAEMATDTNRLAVAAEEQGHDFKTSIEIAREQVQKSATQAEASVEANSIARDALARSAERPILIASIVIHKRAPLPIQDALANKPNPEGFALNLLLNNVGSSTAVRLKSEFYSRIKIQSKTSSEDTHHSNSCDACTADFLYPKDTKNINDTIISNPNSHPERFGSTQILGKVHYQNSQGRQYYRNVCVVVNTLGELNECEDAGDNGGD